MTTTPTTPQDPPLECDLVMKGGITSGVVYPLAVCELASVYRLRSVGGASAGAIAAAAAATAELGRATGGFERLAAIPQRLGEPATPGGPGWLFTLFVPQRGARRMFRVAVAGLGTLGMGRARAILVAALVAYAVLALVGAAPGVLLAVLAVVLGGGAAWVGVVAGLVLAAVGGAVGVLLGLYSDLRRLPELGFGLCSGLTTGAADDPALTPWLHETFQGLAGRTTADPPVTFGDLEAAGIRLQLMTTNLTRRQPLSMPWESGGYYFDPAHFRTLFPEPVVAHLEGTPERSRDWRSRLAHAQALARPVPLRPFPAPADLPVLVAVRMSLSFPGLISAVPLHAVDFAAVVNQERVAAADRWHREHPDATPEQAATELEPLLLRPNWFSDGGICANLPLHFFDSALPRRPTFAIDLADFPSDRPKASDEKDNSFLPTTNRGGVLRRQAVWHDGGLGALLDFGFAVVETARTWVDEAQLGMPGYRDRVVTVFHDDQEGGLNLDMDLLTVRALSERGRGAAERLVERFAGERPGVDPAPGWDNHRWIRFRTATAGLDGWLGQFRTAYTTTAPGTTAYSAWAGVDDDGSDADTPPPSYTIARGREHAVDVRTEALVALATEWSSDPEDAFTKRAPEPRPAMKLVPAERAGADPLEEDAGAG